jgi:hypothetical protein
MAVSIPCHDILTAMKTCINILHDQRLFTISDFPEESPPPFTPISPALTEDELREELIGRGVKADIADDLIARVNAKAPIFSKNFRQHF